MLALMNNGIKTEIISTSIYILETAGIGYARLNVKDGQKEMLDKR
jgi:hypothetical protein